jgi:hypothetical protein
MSRESILIYIIVIALLLWRLSRPQRITVTRMWIAAGLLMVVAGLLVYESFRLYSPPVWEVGAAALAGLVLGVPVGMLRGHHTQVSATDRPGVIQLGQSWQTAAIYIGAFVARFAIRAFFPTGSTAGNIVGDGLMFFAIGFLCMTYVAVYRKYEALDHRAPQAG